MKNLIFGFLLVAWPYISIAQDISNTDVSKKPCYDCYDSVDLYKPHDFSECNKEFDGAYLNERLRIRKRNFNFHKTLRYIQPPSTLSGGTITSYTINTLGYDKKNFVLDADVQFPIAIGGKRFGLNTIQIIPRFKVRIFQDDQNVPFGVAGDTSLAVRTPSTIPGIAYYFSFNRWWDPTRRYDRALKNEFPRNERHEFRDNKYLGVYIFHHSNGQDGNEIAPNDSVNIYNGNYGEQVVFEFIYGQQRKFVPTGDLYGQRKLEKRNIDKNKKGIFAICLFLKNRQSQMTNLNTPNTLSSSFQVNVFRIGYSLLNDVL